MKTLTLIFLCVAASATAQQHIKDYNIDTTTWKSFDAGKVQKKPPLTLHDFAFQIRPTILDGARVEFNYLYVQNSNLLKCAICHKRFGVGARIEMMVTCRMSNGGMLINLVHSDCEWPAKTGQLAKPPKAPMFYSVPHLTPDPHEMPFIHHDKDACGYIHHYAQFDSVPRWENHAPFLSHPAKDSIKPLPIKK